MTTTSTNYTGRTIDILMMSNANFKDLVNIDMSLNDPKITTGIQKAAQRFLSMLLTASTSSLMPTAGSTFITRILQGTISNEEEAGLLFSQSASNIITYLDNKTGTSVPRDERIASATLENISITGDTLSIEVTLTSLAGTGLTLFIPVKAVIK